MKAFGRIRDVSRELWLLLAMFAVAALLNFAMASHYVLLGLFGLPVLASAYLYGRRHAVMTAIFSIAIVVLLVNHNPYSFRDQGEPRQLSIWLNFTIWGSILVITAYGMGSLRELLKRQALYDDLTKLPNRRLFRDRLEHAMAGTKRKESIVGLIFVDLDGFKLVNDSLGHSAGDVLLAAVAARLIGRVRASDTFARIGGDEFALVLEDLASKSDGENIARELLAEFESPFIIRGHELRMTASVGISFCPDDALDAEELTRQADTAMYIAKSNGKNGYERFVGHYGDEVREQLELENHIRSAMEREEWVLHYQPEFEVGGQRLVRFEARIRWNHPTLGLISPQQFAPIAERTGLIVPIGNWVFEQACMEAVKWQKHSGNPVQMAVNVSAIQLRCAHFVANVASVLRRTGLRPELLQLELTESVLVAEFREAMSTLAELHALGVRMAIKEFGTGYLPLSYLHHLTFDIVKIDCSFPAGTSIPAHSRATLLSIVELAHNLKMSVAMEGIETASQLEFVTALGCDEVQGKFLGEPVADPSRYFEEGASPAPSEGAGGPPSMLGK
jgi:diguanylate cyclase (GGDEF)-like protein